eukprot:m.313930 g.313930  ORF g.313930 m.313930 type:complete len:190 (-) comp20262_c0_seq4:130-699(-)
MEQRPLEITWENIAVYSCDNSYFRSLGGKPLPDNFRIPCGCDSEIFDLITKKEFNDFTGKLADGVQKDVEEHAAAAIANEISEEVFENVDMMEEHTAKVERWKIGPCRVELWTISESGMGDGFCCIQDSTGHCLIVGCISCHPFVYTNVCNFVNSDGSTEWAGIDSSGPLAAVHSAINLATLLIFEQEH